jgi:hypothetical protein
MPRCAGEGPAMDGRAGAGRSDAVRHGWQQVSLGEARASERGMPRCAGEGPAMDGRK